LIHLIKREVIIYLIIFFVLSFIVHFDAWLDHPAMHLESLSSSSLGLFHPLYLSFVIYLIFGLLRLFITFLKRIFKKNENNRV